MALSPPLWSAGRSLGQANDNIPPAAPVTSTSSGRLSTQPFVRPLKSVNEPATRCSAMMTSHSHDHLSLPLFGMAAKARQVNITSSRKNISAVKDVTKSSGRRGHESRNSVPSPELEAEGEE